MSQQQLSHKDRLRIERRVDESFVRTYTRHGKMLPQLSPEDEVTMEFFNAIQRELKHQRLQAIYADHEQ